MHIILGVFGGLITPVCAHTYILSESILCQLVQRCLCVILW